MDFVGKQVIVRGDASGVFYGTLKGKSGREVTLSRCRRIWYWDGAASISQLAVDGTSNPGNCKFTVYVMPLKLYRLHRKQLNQSKA